MTTDDPSLFDLAAPPTPPPPPKLSAGQRLTLRQAARLALGWNPIGGKLHPQAAPADNRQAAGLRCGTCRHRILGTYPKCALSAITRGPATDCRAWWPACTSYQPRED